MRQMRCCPEDSRTRSTMCSGNSPQPSRYGLGWEEWHTTVSSLSPFTCFYTPYHFVESFRSLIPRPSSGHDHSHHDLCYRLLLLLPLWLTAAFPSTYLSTCHIHMHTHSPPPHPHTYYPHMSYTLTYPTSSCTPHSPHIPHPTQVILLSATMPMDVLDVTKRFMREPIRILVKKEELTLEGIRQFYIQVEKEVSRYLSFSEH